ncbi:acyl-CoA dehydrogenase family protein [Solirubrobacter ginsenosidimutans]|uniref:Acyl-CoA dehydrogenase family protein n=1 Tax=Solirubrobacter ginsenosidimutans TaxID=490573 RepID=A0A9X3MN49_9ACTN|nr:acyl-CoA dehydrogenase family protein [Solirubrobacter ginsenosidimutans]MDA0158666.1 acyl-CoA dehydrogenase family protein [Solirubrobacter ginsenosidimutans]
MDLELTDEQTMLGEALTTLLEREWLPAETAHTATPQQRARLWSALEEFFDAELGAVELCLAARLLGAHLAATPFVGSAALRYIGVPHQERVAIALPATPVEHAAEVDRFAVVGEGTVALVAAADATIEPAASLDIGTPLFTVTADGGELHEVEVARLTAIGALLAAAESVGAAERMLSDARDYAAERRQFGRTIGSYQALRHLLADMYVRSASAWSTVLYAAAALDDELPDAQRTAAITKAYVARAAREVAHGALQVFGGIAFTEEHQAHRFLRRIIVREQQFGDAAHHERELGRALAVSAMERA